MAFSQCDPLGVCVRRVPLYGVTDTYKGKLKLGEVEGATIPCFDLHDLEQLGEKQRLDYVQAFGKGLEECGFVAVYVPELTNQVKKALEITEKYFTQSSDVKMKDWHDNNGQSGYSFEGHETAAGSKVADQKETFFVPYDFSRFPESIPEFEEVIDPYYKTMSGYADRIMRLVIEYLGKSTDLVDLKTAGNLLRLAYYPSSKKCQREGAVWAGAHQDLNAITLLPRPSRSGLQVKTKEGTWLPVTVPEDYMIINLGEQFERFTSGKLKGAEHRVVDDDPADDSARCSTIFFASFPEKFELQPGITVELALKSRLIELGSYVNPSRDEIVELLNLGLLKKPPDTLVETYSDLFSKK